MFAQFIQTIIPSIGRKAARRALAEQMYELVEEEGRLVLNDSATARLGSERIYLIKAACDLALEERIHIRECSEELEHMEIISNSEFMRIINGEPPFSRLRCVASAHLSVPEQEMTAEAESIPFPSPPIPDHTMESMAEGLEESADADLAWFELDVAPPDCDEAETAEKFVLDRQSLPERKREPWIVFDDATMDGFSK